MEENIEQKTIKKEAILEVKKKPIWKIILMWIAGIWAILVLADAVIGLFMFFTVGMEIEAGRVLAWIIALYIIEKLEIIKYKR